MQAETAFFLAEDEGGREICAAKNLEEKALPVQCINPSAKMPVDAVTVPPSKKFCMYIVCKF